MAKKSNAETKKRRQRVLILEDETATRKLIVSFLKRNGYDCMETWTVHSAEHLIRLQEFDFVILDLGLEDQDGFQLLRNRSGSDPIFIVVSSRTDIVDRLLSFELGADDYMIKPINLRELLLRLQRSNKRHLEIAKADVASSLWKIDGEIIFNLHERAIFIRDRIHCMLNRREFKALCLFLEQPNKLISRDEISRNATGRRNQKESRSVDVLVSNIRAKLASAGSKSKIQNIRGEGYMFQIGENASEGPGTNNFDSVAAN